MTPELLALLRCPDCQGRLSLSVTDCLAERIKNGSLTCDDCSHRFPVVGGIPRFAPSKNYADSFGIQWNRFRRAQLDSYTGIPISYDRFVQQTGWSARDLKSKEVLDAGCGAGRFSEIALALGANLVSLDYSSAVDACATNIGSSPSANVVQADIYNMPFRPESFEFVYCFGVLQHTPDVKRAFMALVDQLKPGGKLAVDVYLKTTLNLVWPKYWLRPITRRLPSNILYSVVRLMVKTLFPLSNAVSRVPRIGRKLKYVFPIANYSGVYPLSKAQLREWALLDTFDMLSPRYDQPQNSAELRNLFKDAKLRNIEVFRAGVLVGRGEK